MIVCLDKELAGETPLIKWELWYEQEKSEKSNLKLSTNPKEKSEKSKREKWKIQKRKVKNPKEKSENSKWEKWQIQLKTVNKSKRKEWENPNEKSEKSDLKLMTNQI